MALLIIVLTIVWLEIFLPMLSFHSISKIPLAKHIKIPKDLQMIHSIKYTTLDESQSNEKCILHSLLVLWECKVCGVQYVGSICTPFRNRFNNYKAACSRKFYGGSSGIPQADFFWQVTRKDTRSSFQWHISFLLSFHRLFIYYFTFFNYIFSFPSCM